MAQLLNETFERARGHNALRLCGALDDPPNPEATAIRRLAMAKACLQRLERDTRSKDHHALGMARVEVALATKALQKATTC